MNPWPGILRWWIGWLTGTVILGMLLSLGAKLAWSGAAAVPWTLGWTAWCFSREKASAWNWQLCIPPLPAVLLIFLCLFSWTSGLTLLSDSFSYRFPQLLLWLQEGHPVWVFNVDSRINGMPHVGSFILAPFYLLLGERALAMPSWISLIILYGALFQWTGAMELPREKGRWIAALFTCSVCFGLQAIATDNALFIAALLAAGSALCASRENQAFIPIGKFDDVVFSALAVALASGSKPQYAAAGVIWLLWFFASPSRPWQRLRPMAWPALIAGGLLVSFVPSWIFAKLHGGELGGVGIGFHPLSFAFWKACSISLLSLMIDLFNPPLNPFYASLTSVIQSLAIAAGIPEADAARILVRPISIPDSASLGLISTSALIFGIGLAVKNRSPKAVRWLALCALILGLIALFLARPGTGGRSYVGYIVLMFPLAMWGLSRLSFRVLAGWAILACLVTMVAVVLTPSHNLLTVNVFKPFANEATFRKLEAYYRMFSQRGRCGSDLVSLLSSKPDLTIHTIVDPNTPIFRLWDNSQHVVFLENPEDLLSQAGSAGAHYLMIRSDRYPDTAETYERLKSLGYSLVAKTWYIGTISEGPRPWMLFEAPQNLPSPEIEPKS